MGYYVRTHTSSTFISSPVGEFNQSPGVSDFTLCAWINCPSAVYGGDVAQDLLIWFFGSAPNACQFRVRGDDGKLEFYIGAGNVISSARVSDDNWHFVAVTCDRDSATGLKLYIDWVEDSDGGSKDPTGSQGVDISIAAVLNELFITSARGAFFDQPRLYKTVLAIEQIQAIRNNGDGVIVDETEFAAIADGWYSECDTGSGKVLAGRKCISGVWSDSNLNITHSTLLEFWRSAFCWFNSYV